jgi:hypothetical protein
VAEVVLVAFSDASKSHINTNPLHLSSTTHESTIISPEVCASAPTAASDKTRRVLMYIMAVKGEKNNEPPARLKQAIEMGFLLMSYRLLKWQKSIKLVYYLPSFGSSAAAMGGMTNQEIK